MSVSKIARFVLRRYSMSVYLARARDPLSSFTHFMGAVVFGAASLPLFLKAAFTGALTPVSFFALLAFALSSIALYGISAYYHYYNGEPERIARLRKWDHSMIYVFIAGTYTPILLTYLPWPKALYFTLFIWGFAAVGIIMKVFWMNTPRWLSSALYILMGWMIIFDPSIFSSIPGGAIALLILGGVSYTVGGVMYALKKPNFHPPLGFHEVFHLFVLGGSLFHYLMVLIYIA